MSDDSNLNDRGNHPGEFSQGVGGWAEYTVNMTEIADAARHDVTVPPGKIIPVIFLPGVMGSNLRMSKKRQDELKRNDNRAWRPDDMVSMSGKVGVVSGEGLGGWFKNASPAQRQLNFDPNETEVEYYHYTESKGRFDPEGKETLAADALHGNVPDSLGSIPPLLGHSLIRQATPTSVRRVTPRKRETPAQIARWRGWSEVMFSGAYGYMLQTAERFLNNMMVKGEVHEMWQSVCVDPRDFGASSGSAISKVDIKKIAACWYPVHAMGYNFLKSNGETAVVIAERIRGLVKGYQQRGFKCDEVIIVTHSMGGLVGRALVHPNYGNLLNDKSVKVLGIYHNVMPTMGAASAYKRMRFGFQEGEGFLANLQARIFGVDGKHATAILANTPAPLEMLPGNAYGQDWLRVVDGAGKTICGWPRDKSNALESIYLQPENAWWRLVNPLWVNPGNVGEDSGGGIERVYSRIKSANKFLNSIEKTFHPTGCYASYCASEEHRSYGEVVFKMMDRDIWDARSVNLPPPESWQLLTDDAKGILTVKAAARVLTLKLQPANAAGDETVPSSRSAQHIIGTLFTHGAKKGKGYEHQNSYSDPQVLSAMLYSIVKMAQSASWK